MQSLSLLRQGMAWMGGIMSRQLFPPTMQVQHPPPLRLEILALCTVISTLISLFSRLSSWVLWLTMLLDSRMMFHSRSWRHAVPDSCVDCCRLLGPARWGVRRRLHATSV